MITATLYNPLGGKEAIQSLELRLVGNSLHRDHTPWARLMQGFWRVDEFISTGISIVGPLRLLWCERELGHFEQIQLSSGHLHTGDGRLVARLTRDGVWQLDGHDDCDELIFQFAV